MKFRTQTVRLRAALVAVALCAACARGMGVQWGNTRDAGDYDAINFVLQNDNPGTIYSSATLRSATPFFGALLAANRAYWPTLSAMLAGGTGGRPNFNIGISTEAGLVNDGWAWSLGADGVIRVYDEGDRNSDEFSYGGIFSGTLYVNKALLVPGGSLAVAANAAQARDVAWSGAGTLYETTPAQVPGCALSATGLAVRAVGVCAACGGREVRLRVGTEGRRQFRVLAADNPASTNWAEALVCASTGLVTEVCETNAAPCRFYRAVSP